MVHLSRAAPVVLLALLAGCAAPPPAAPASAPPAVEVPAAADAFVWSGCRGAAINLDGPAALYPASAPAGWESADPVVLLRVTLLECQRVSWGAFERGPVAIAQEWRTDLAPPESCLREGTDGTQLLESIWFSDAEVAGFALGQGLPARPMEATVRHAASGDEWSWGPPGEEPSSASFAVVPGGDRTEATVERLLWADGAGAGVGALDLRLDAAEPALPQPGATGFLRPPTLYGRANASPAFATPRGQAIADVEASGTLQRFGDLACAQPL